MGVTASDAANQDTLHAPTVDELRQEFAATQERVQSVRIREDVYIGVDAFDRPLADQEPNFVVEFEQSGSKLRAATDGRHGEVQVFDGATMLVYLPEQHEAVVREELPSILAHFAVAVPWWSRVWDRPFGERLAHNTLQPGVEPVEGDQGKLWMVSGECHDSPELRFRLYLDPAIGWMPRVVEQLVFRENVERLQCVYRFRDYERAADEVWLPRRIEEEGREGAEVVRRNLYVVTECEVNTLIPDERFDITLPIGTHVFDEASRTDFINKDDPDLNLETLKRRFGSAKR